MCKYQLYSQEIDHNRHQRKRWQYLYMIATDPQVKDRVLKLIFWFDSDIKRLENGRLTIEKAIESIEQEQDRELMRLRYIDGLTWSEIAEQMYYSERYIYKAHNRVLKMIGCSL